MNDHPINSRLRMAARNLLHAHRRGAGQISKLIRAPSDKE